MPHSLYGATLLIAAALTLYAVASSRPHAPGTATANLPSVPALLTVAMVLAILANGTNSTVGRYVVVVVVVFTGVAWLAWAETLRRADGALAGRALRWLGRVSSQPASGWSDRYLR